MTQTDDIVALDDVLLDDTAAAGIADAVHRAAQSTELAEALAEVPPGLREVALGELTRAIRTALHADLLEPLAAGWRRFQALTDAARRTVEEPGSEEVVDLAMHEITSSIGRSIDVFVDDLKRKELRLEIDVTIDVHALIAVVVAGRLVAVRSGRAEVRADVRCDGIDIPLGSHEVDLGLTLRLGSGIELVEPPDVTVLP